MTSRTALFAAEPPGDLRGLAALTDPDDDVAAVIDLAIMGARGDGKTQFIVHAIRALHAHAPPLEGHEHELNRSVMRLVLDPRAPRPDATPPGVVPHFTFRLRAAALYERASVLGRILLACRIAKITGALALAALLIAGGVIASVAVGAAVGVIAVASGALVGAVAALVARQRIEAAGDVEVAFWDVAGEQIYSETAADYHALLARLVAARRARATKLGRAYAFAPVLICNPLALGTSLDGSPYERLRELLPLFAAVDREASRALVAINRWAVVDPICARGALRDEVVAVSARGVGDPERPAHHVARERVRAICLDAEDGRDGHIHVRYLRYDTALRSAVEVGDDGALRYEYDDGPGAFSVQANRGFLDWLLALPRWTRARAAVAEPVAAPVSEPAPIEVAPALAPALDSSHVWGRPPEAR